RESAKQACGSGSTAAHAVDPSAVERTSRPPEAHAPRRSPLRRPDGVLLPPAESVTRQREDSMSYKSLSRLVVAGMLCAVAAGAQRRVLVVDSQNRPGTHF